MELAMWVEVENKLGKVRSDILDIYAADLGRWSEMYFLIALEVTMIITFPI